MSHPASRPDALHEGAGGSLREEILEAAPYAIIVLDEERRIEIVNRRTEELFGYERSDLLGRPAEHLLPYALASARPGVPATQDPASGLALHGRRNDGSEFPVEVSTVRIGAEAVSFTAVTVRDLSDLEKAERKFRVFVEAAPDAIVIVDEAGRIALVNAQAERLFQRSRQEMLGQGFEMLVADGSPDSVRDRFFSDPGVYGAGASVEFTARRNNSSEIPAEMSVTLLESDGERLVSMAIRDVSERKEAERRLREIASKLARSNTELQDFAYVASHDLREPLRKIQAFGQRLAQKFVEELGEQGADYLGRMRDAASRMEKLIDGLLVFSRVTTKAKPFAPVDLGLVVCEVLSDLEIRVEEAGACVEVGDLPTIGADALQMRQLFQNLIGNALKYHRDDVAPRVEIRAETFADRRRPPNPHGVCRITVEDNGIGFDPQYAERIFGVFQRLHGRGEYEGMGIGLAVCRKIVERHGGHIGAEGRPGEGARFIVTLPVEPPALSEGDA